MEAIHAPEAHKSVFHIMNHAGSPVGPFDVESIFTLTLNEDGTKVCSVEEMVDSEYLNAFFAKPSKLEEEKAE